MKAEEEYRVVYFPDMSDPKIKIRVKDELLIPYYEYSDEIRKAIKSITVAPQNKNDLTLDGIQYLLNSYGIESKVPSNDEDELGDQVAITRSQITSSLLIFIELNINTEMCWCFFFYQIRNTKQRIII